MRKAKPAARTLAHFISSTCFCSVLLMRVSALKRADCADISGALQSQFGVSSVYVSTHTAAFESGRKLASLASFEGGKGGSTAEALSKMYGAWIALYGAGHVAFLRA